MGVEIDDKLNFDNHVSILVRRVRQTQAAIRRVGRRFPKALGAMLINAMLVSKMTYGSILFLNNKKHLKKLQKMLNDSIRFVARKKIAEKVNMKMLSKEMGIPTLKMVYQKQALMEVIKMEQREDFFVKMFEKTRDHTNKKFRPYGKKQKAKKSCLATMVKLWNNYCKSVQSLELFQLKRFLKKEFIL